MSKWYIKTLSSPNLRSRLSRPMPAFVHILTGVMFPPEVLVTSPGLHLSTSLDLHFNLFSHLMCHQQSQRSSGHLFRMASRQTATIATSCSIWPHEILAFTTSAFPSFYSSYILAHFQVFTVQSHATQLTALRRRSYVSVNNTSGELFSLPVIFVFEEVGGGSDVFV